MMRLSVTEVVALLAVTLALGLGIGWAIERKLVSRRREAWREKNRSRQRGPDRSEGPMGSGPRSTSTETARCCGAVADSDGCDLHDPAAAQQERGSGL